MKKKRNFRDSCLLEIRYIVQRQEILIGEIMTQVNDLAPKLNEQAVVVQKIITEIAALKDALQNMALPADAEAALANLAALIKTADDQNPDAEPAPEEPAA